MRSKYLYFGGFRKVNKMTSWLRSLDDWVPWGSLWEWLLMVISLGSLGYEIWGIWNGEMTISRWLRNAWLDYPPLALFAGAIAFGLALRLRKNSSSHILWWAQMIWLLALVHVFWWLV